MDRFSTRLEQLKSNVNDNCIPMLDIIQILEKEHLEIHPQVEIKRYALQMEEYQRFMSYAD